MAKPLLLRNLAWAATTALEFILLISVARHRMYRSHPLFCLYVFSIIAQSALAFGVYRQWGFFSYTAWHLAWGSQGIVVLIRTLAVWEVTRRLLAAYSGVWGLASKILLAVGIAVAFACILLSRRTFYDGAMDADRGVELSLATVIVCVFLFLRYYGLEAKATDRQLALGFCLYSSFFVVNLSIFERYLQTYVHFWNFLDILAFLATLFIWTKAARSYSITPETETPPLMTEPGITKDAYAGVSRQLNRRLTSLNERLNRLSGLRDKRH
jgi:hypothetical protein